MIQNIKTVNVAIEGIAKEFRCRAKNAKLYAHNEIEINEKEYGECMGMYYAYTQSANILFALIEEISGESEEEEEESEQIRECE